MIGREFLDKKFSIVLPTRERTGLLNNMLASIVRNTANLNDIEVLLAVDTDDSMSWTYLRGQVFPWLKVFPVARSLNFSRDYYSYLAHQCRGLWIITANDDCTFETPQWDIKACEVLKERPGVVYGWIEDGLGEFRGKGHGNYCCFPLQGRAGVEALGYIFPPRIPTWGADIWAIGLYNQVNSVATLPFTMKHKCYHNKSRPQDHINMHVAKNQVAYDFRPTYQEVNALLGALKKEKDEQTCKV